MLGGALNAALAAVFRVHPFTWKTLDITDEGALARAFDRLGPHTVVNSAALTDVDGCESRREEAFAVNARGAGNAARAAAAAGAFFVHLSTDYVFDGEKEGSYLPGDAVAPLNAYGESKLAGEEAVRAAGSRHLILRTSWLFGPGGRNFVAAMLALARTRRDLPVVDDQRGRPTYTRDLAAAIARLAVPTVSPLLGTHHLANAGDCSWHIFAREIFRQTGLPVAVRPVAGREFSRPARRPHNSVLDCSTTEAALGGPLPPWQDALSRYLREIGAGTEP
jgi:dTDP-4-dehydrorhamnose reductase